MLSHLIKLPKISQALVVFCFLAAFFLGFSTAFAADDINQQILDLRKQIEELTKQAEQYKGTILQKQKEANTLQRQIDILNNQILQLQTRISITDRQIGATKLEIQDLEGQIFNTGEKIGKQKQAIGELLFFLYERDRFSLVAILLKSSRLSDFASEAQQAQNVNSKLLGLLIELKEQKEKLQQDKEQVELKKAELETLNQKQVSQRDSLSGTKSAKGKLLTETRGQETRYQKLLSDVEKKEAEFFAELRKLEAEAVKTGAYIVHVTADRIPSAGSKIFQWPYEDFYLTQSYGMTSYAKRGAYSGAPHNGVDISAGYGEPINPMADGVVLASGYNNGWGYWVAVRHPNLGNLVTLYAHLRSPAALANGTPVSKSSIIGYEGSTGHSTGSHLHLSIYSDFFTYINPQNNQLYFNYFEGTLNPLNYLP